MIQGINLIQNNKLRKSLSFSAPQASSVAVTAPTSAATSVQMPTKDRNYCIFDQKRVDSFVAQGKEALPQLRQILETSKDEGQIVEALYILDRLADKNTKGIPHMYPLLAKFNNTDSPNIQSYLAGIYRKTQVPDAFGPLIAMLIKNPVKPLAVGLENPTYSSRITPHASPFDPNEEIGGAILEYISVYSKEKPLIDYSA